MTLSVTFESSAEAVAWLRHMAKFKAKTTVAALTEPLSDRPTAEDKLRELQQSHGRKAA
jgi:hypothetical protein